MQTCVNVVIFHKSKYVDRPYSYLCREPVLPGQRVLVPFGKGGRLYEAMVLSVDPNMESAKALKEVAKVLDEPAISEKKIALAHWIKEEYLCSLNEALQLFIPKTGAVSEQYMSYLVPTVTRSELEGARDALRKSATSQRLVLDLLMEGELCIQEVQSRLQKQIVKSAEAIVQMGLARMEQRRVSRRPHPSYQLPKRSIALSRAQRTVLEATDQNVQQGSRTLLYGVTGSGKTEVYIALIERCLARGKQALLLVPEISLTPQTIARFENVFGNQIGVLHSQVSQGERKDQYDLIRSGVLRIVIGARSAMFAPLEELGLVIIDECHDDAYRSEQTPKYDSVKVAEQLCVQYGAGLVIGSATPSVEQYYDAVYGSYDLQTLAHREKGILPQIELIDLLQEQREGQDAIVSDRVREEIAQTIAQNQQAIVFLNRRGYAGTLSCNVCGHTVMCPHCDISLTYHKSVNRLQCHYCGHSEELVYQCRACEKGSYRAQTFGTQRIEQELREIEGAHCVRLDRDTTAAKGAHEQLLERFKNQEANILIGTQMISKGLDFEHVSLVVVLNADQGLHFPDYRNREKTLSMLMQVAGRAGRGLERGRVLVQTKDAKNPIFAHLKEHSYSDFFWEEIKERKAFFYPPFTTLVRVQCTSDRFEDAAETAQKLQNAVAYYLKQRNVGMICLGPAPNLVHKIDSRYRWQIFYKAGSEEELILLKRILRYALSEKRALLVNRGTSVSVDLNPNNIL